MIFLKNDIQDAEKNLKEAKEVMYHFIDYSKICRTCKQKYGIKKYYGHYCSFNCMNDDHSTWTDFGDDDEESVEAENIM